MILERKVAINSYGSRHGIEGFILFRLASKLPMTPQVAKEAVINHIQGEFQAAFANGNFSESKRNIYCQDIEILRKLPIVYVKQMTHHIPDGEIYYTQLLLDLTSGVNSTWQPSSYSILPDMVGGMLGAVYGGYGITVSPRCPLPDFTYELANIKFGARGSILRSAGSNEFNRYVYEHVMVPLNNIAIAQETNLAKTYNRNSLIRLQYHIFDNIAEAINGKNTGTFNISAYDGAYGTLVFGHLGDQPNGVYRIQMMYKSKVHAFWYGKMLVCYDGNKSLECVKPYFDEWNTGGIRQVDILQFCGNRDFFYQEDMSSEVVQVNKMVLHFLNKDKLYASRSGINYRNGSMTGQIYYQPAKGRKITPINLTLKSLNQSYFAELVLPVDDKNTHLNALQHIGTLIGAKLHPGADMDVNLAFTEYKSTLFSTAENQDDVLAKWFAFCTKSSKSTDDGIVRAYIKMKANLEKEYKEISSYLNCYDFSKCMAVPRIEMDKKLRENCYKTLHVEPKNIIIKSINNKKINPISETRPTVKFMVVSKGICAVGEMPLNKYYDAKTNSVLLNYNKMKGEVIRDKIKNR